MKASGLALLTPPSIDLIVAIPQQSTFTTQAIVLYFYNLVLLALSGWLMLKSRIRRLIGCVLGITPFSAFHISTLLSSTEATTSAS